MAARKAKNMTGAEFNGKYVLVLEDLQDVMVTGFREASKNMLEEFDWDKYAVLTVGLTLSNNNKSIINAKIHMIGDLMDAPKDVRAKKLFEKFPSDLRIFYLVKDISAYTFSSGTLVGDYLDCSDITWYVEKKIQGEANICIEPHDYGKNHVGSFCLHPYIIPLSGQKAKVQVLVYPLSLDDLKDKYPLYKDPAFPGLEIANLEVALFPHTNTETGKDWGSPILLLLLPGGDLEDHPIPLV